MFSSFTAKRTIGGGGKGLAVRLVMVIVFYALIKSGSFAHFDTRAHFGVGVAFVGVVLCGLGVAFAIWARIHLGRNWGMPMSVKENPELVTSGPYEYVRHPIYSGMMLAMLGSALASSFVWFVALGAFLVYFIFAAKAEEALMMNQFPTTYPDYKKRSKMLVPFIF